MRVRVLLTISAAGARFDEDFLATHSPRADRFASKFTYFFVGGTEMEKLRHIFVLVLPAVAVLRFLDKRVVKRDGGNEPLGSLPAARWTPTSAVPYSAHTNVGSILLP